MPNCHCGKRANYNVKGEKAKFCKAHKDPTMIDVNNKKCQADGCIKQPKYNFKGEKPLFCSEHKQQDMINLVNKTCEIEECRKLPAYNFRGEKKGRFCFDHKELEMINVVSKMCEKSGCEIQAIFNIKGKKRGKFCVTHKEDGMVDVTNKVCKTPGCTKQPAFNFKGEKKGLFCVDHKEDDMVNVVSKTCEMNGCEIQPTYNIRGEKKGRFCVTHKKDGMINVIDKLCESNGCNTVPFYNFKGLKKGRFCALHKEDNMIDIFHKNCEEGGCITRPYYGFLGKSASHCSRHRLKGMIRSSTKKCHKCKQLGTHEENGLRYCDKHKSDNAENLGIEKCIVCGLDDILTNQKCSTCDPEIIKIRQKAKENRVKDFFDAKGIRYIQDKMLEGPMCGRERPDFQIDCGSHFVYVEVDENQHQSYACECEQMRMINLTEVRGMPVRWIRYNPDFYESSKKCINIDQREKTLLECVNWSMQHSPQLENCISSVLYLFYDDYDNSKTEWIKLI